MLKIAHRVNTAAELRRAPVDQGVEVDLRDRGDRLILQHDPFSDGEDFEDYLRDYHHRFLILNIKSERIEHRVLELVRQANITEYFLLDCSFPMIRLLSEGGERRIALRFSESEPVEGVVAMAGKVDWVWVDCFTRLPFTPEDYRRLKECGFKLCVVSPELQGRPAGEIESFMQQLSAYPVDAVCTKRPDLWTLL
ncbi:MAG: hypothetical protein M3Y56_02495 [Armatimonadota bacterium]|nr:hypothetical protein [Armatimonadota bacterium]